MLEKVLSKNSSIIISTGNVLSVNKKPGQKPDLEVICLEFEPFMIKLLIICVCHHPNPSQNL